MLLDPHITTFRAFYGMRLIRIIATYTAEVNLICELKIVSIFFPIIGAPRNQTPVLLKNLSITVLVFSIGTGGILRERAHGQQGEAQCQSQAHSQGLREKLLCHNFSS